MVLNVHRNHKAYQGRGKGVGWEVGVGEGVMEVREEGDYNGTSRYTVTTRMTSASSRARAYREGQTDPSLMLWTALRGHSQTTRAIILTDSNELATKSEK